MTAKLYICILWPEKLRPNDIQITRPPTLGEPGQARLIRAHHGEARPEAPNSLPLLSQSKATIGFIAHIKHIEEPYNDSYIIS